MNARDRRGRTPIHVASEGGHVDVIRLLLEKPDIEINAEVQLYWGAALSIASHHGRVDVVKLLTQRAEIDVNAGTELGRTALHLASFLCFVLLQRADININARDMKLLIERAGTEVNAELDNGRTHLQSVATSGRAEVVKLLFGRDSIEISVVVRMKDQCVDGRTPGRMAVIAGHAVVAKLFLKRLRLCSVLKFGAKCRGGEKILPDFISTYDSNAASGCSDFHLFQENRRTEVEYRASTQEWKATTG